jgi:hypothetical protein
MVEKVATHKNVIKLSLASTPHNIQPPDVIPSETNSLVRRRRKE